MARKTKLESALTRERILDAAENEMGVHGVAQTSLESIARHADVTRGAIYWHFADKSALLEAMIARTHLPMRDLRECLAQHVAGQQPYQLLREMLLHGLKRLADDHQHRRVCHIFLHRCEMTARGHPVETLLAAMFSEARDNLLSLCHEIADLGQLRDGLTPADATDIIMAFMCGQYECSLRHPGIYTVGRKLEPKVDALLRGLFQADANTAMAAVTENAGAH